MIKTLLLYCSILFMLLPVALAAQTDEKLAKQYFENREYAKAAELYEVLAQKDLNNVEHYDHYLQCLLYTSQFDKASKLVLKRKKKFESYLLYAIDEGYVLEKQGKVPDAEKVYTKIINGLGNNNQAYYAAAEAFRKRGKYSFMVKTFERGDEVFGEEADFSSRLAAVYMETGDRERGLERYVKLMLGRGYPYDQVKQMLEMNVDDSTDFAILRGILLKNLQKEPDNWELNDLLKWTFIKQKDWQAAFVQTRALDKRSREKGEKMIELGELCMSNEAWAVASQCFDYVKSLGASNPYYNHAISGLLETRYKQLEITAVPATETINTLEAEMLVYISEKGNSDFSWRVISRLSELYTKYLHTPDKAIVLLENFYKSPGITARTKAAAKLALGDAYVMDEDVWSSELLYAQVEKDFPEDATGQEAKFRRARLSYYRGDFDWAMVQLDALKGATTQLISNNAIRLALTITENLGIDSNYDALNRFANAELLISQNTLEQAERELDSIPALYPGHSLSDDILMQKAIIREKQLRFNDAVELYNTLIVAFNHDILTDNAWYNLGLLYENKIGDKAKAKAAFEKIIQDFPGSIYAIDARVHYRKLRGDNI